MFRLKLPQQDQGFTLVEVLVAILIASTFVTVALQMVAIAALLKARAQQFTKATAWIQEDLEDVKYKAANFSLPNTSLTANVSAGASSINVALTDKYAANDTIKVGSDPDTYTISSISGNTLNITPSLGTTQSLYAWVVATRCNAGSVLTANAASGASSINVASTANYAANDKIKVGSDPGTYTISSVSGNVINITPSLATAQLQRAVVVTPKAGFADGLRDTIATSNQDYVDITKTDSFTNKQFILKRTTTLSNNYPYNVLQLSYDVSPSSGGSSIAKFYTEVIPNAGLQCP